MTLFTKLFGQKANTNPSMVDICMQYFPNVPLETIKVFAHSVEDLSDRQMYELLTERYQFPNNEARTFVKDSKRYREMVQALKILHKAGKLKEAYKKA